MRYPDSRLGRTLMSRGRSRYGSPVGNSQDPFGLVGMASGVAKFWLRTSIRTQEQLIADEARIISALSDGSSSPLVSVHDWTRRRVQGRAVLENASLIGRTANVALPAMVPSYVSHLLSLGLVEVGPEDPDLKDD